MTDLEQERERIARRLSHNNGIIIIESREWLDAFGAEKRGGWQFDDMAARLTRLKGRPMVVRGHDYMGSVMMILDATEASSWWIGNPPAVSEAA